MTGETRMWTNHHGGYFVCRHQGCSKKVNPDIAGHDCWGRCRQGRECLRDTQMNYDGPGTFAHAYWETWLKPGECATCGDTRGTHRR